MTLLALPTTTTIPTGHYRCTHCGTVKPLSEYPRNWSKPTRHDVTCKACRNEAQRRSRLERIERDYTPTDSVKLVPARWEILGFSLPTCTDDCAFWGWCCQQTDGKAIDDPACFVDSPRFAEFKQQYGKSAKKGKA